MIEFLLVIGSYFFGAVPFSYVISRLIGGIDIRTKGSGNVGATNVYRTLGPYIGITAAVADILKGVITALIGLWIGGPIIGALCGLAAVIGHCYSIFLQLKGGKGVATAAGAMIVLTPKVFLIIVAIFVTIIFVSRYVSLGSICVAALFPILTLLLSEHYSYTLMALVMALIVIYRHRENIYRLRNGTETKINEKAV